MREEKKRDNHYVPKSYLRQWSNNGNTVWTYDTIVWSERQKLWESKNVGGQAHWKDFYSQVNDDGTIDDSIETLFGDEYESRTGNAFKKVREDNKLSDEDMHALVDFAILQMVRTPAWYSDFNEMIADVFPSATNRMLDKLEAEGPAGLLARQGVEGELRQPPVNAPFPEFDVGVGVDEATGEIAVTLGVGRRGYLASVGHILRGGVRNRMHGYDWSVVEMPDGVMLPTCDNPFVRLSVRPGKRPTLKGGVGDENTWLFMPLNPCHLLFSRVGGGNFDSRILADEPRLVELVAGSIVQNAFRYVYHRKACRWITNLRPRRVDPEFCKKMDQLMRNWNDLHS